MLLCKRFHDRPPYPLPLVQRIGELLSMRLSRAGDMPVRDLPLRILPFAPGSSHS